MLKANSKSLGSTMFRSFLASALAVSMVPVLPSIAFAEAQTTFQENVDVVKADGTAGSVAMTFYIETDATVESNGQVFIGKSTDAGSWSQDTSNLPSCTSDTTFKEINLPSTITHNGMVYDVIGLAVQAFGGTNDWGSSPYTNLEKVSIPASIDRVGNHTFTGCAKLTTVDIAEGALEQLKTIQGAQASSNWMLALTGLEELTLPDSVAYLPNNFLSGCKNLKTIVFKGDASDIADQPLVTATGDTSGSTSIYTPITTVIYEGKKSQVTWKNTDPKPTEYYTVTYADGQDSSKTYATLKVKAGADLQKLTSEDVLVNDVYTGSVIDVPAGEKQVLDSGVTASSLNDSCTILLNADPLVRYSASVAEGIQHGSISLSMSSGLNAGDKVTVTVNPDDGYELDALTCSAGTDAVAVEESNGTHSFVMPHGDVVVSATFKTQEPIQYNADCSNPTQGTYTSFGESTSGSGVTMSAVGRPEIDIANGGIITTAYSRTRYFNKITEVLDNNYDITFAFVHVGPGGRWSDRADEAVYPYIGIYSDINCTNLVASISNGKIEVKNVEWRSDIHNWATEYTLQIAKGTIDAGTYYLKFDKNMRTQGQNENSQGPLGADIYFEFQVSTSVNQGTVAIAVKDAQALLDAQNLSEDDTGADVSPRDTWVTKEAARIFADAISQAKSIADDSSATEAECQNAINALLEAQKEFSGSIKSGLQVYTWNIGKTDSTKAVATLKPDGTLVFSGEGDFAEYTKSGNVPWKDWRDFIKSVEFSESVAPTQLRYFFYGCTALTEAPVIPNGVINLNSTFYGCKSLTEAPVIPNGVINLNSTFSSCTSLTEAPVIPNGVTSLSSTFSSCKSLTEAPVIPDTVTSLSSTFSGCTSLTEAPVIPGTVTELYRAFSGCTSLTEAPVIPDSVTSLTSAFQGCTSLTEAPVIPNGVIYLSSTFYGCTSLSEAPVIPDTVTNLGYAFQGCTSLTEAPVIPNGVTNLGYTFKGCTSLTKAPDIPDTVTNLSYTFQNCTALTTPPVLKGDCTAYLEYTFSGCTALTKAPVIPETVKKMYYTFENCTSLVQPSNIPSLATSAQGIYSGCTSLESMPRIDDSATTTTLYLNLAFKNCTALKEIAEFPSRPLYLLEAFYGCTSLTKVADIPENVTNLTRTFMGCTSLTKAPAINSNWKGSLSNTFQNCTSLKEAPVIPEGTTSLWGTFYGCTSLTKAPFIPVNVTSTSYMFYGCDSLTQLPKGFTIPASVTKKDQMFKASEAYSPSNPLKMYVDSDADESVTSYDWGADCRELVLSSSASSQQIAAFGVSIYNAKQMTEGVLESEDGTDLTPDQKWVTAEKMQALMNAISAAEKLLNRENLLAAEVEDTASALAAAVADFQPAAGTKVVPSHGTDGASSGNTPAQPASPDQDAADSVVAAIDGIGSVSADSKAAIESARAAYDALTAEQKALVPATALEALIAAEAAYAEINASEPEPSPDPTPEPEPATTTRVYKNVTYTISGNSVKVTGIAKNVKTVTIRATIKIGDKTYKVTAIPAKAFKGCTKLTKLTIGANIKSIGSSAFSGCTKLKTITISSKKLTKTSVKNALKGSNVTTVKVPVSKVKAYAKIFTKANCGKKVKVVKA